MLGVGSEEGLNLSVHSSLLISFLIIIVILFCFYGIRSCFIF